MTYRHLLVGLALLAAAKAGAVEIQLVAATQDKATVIIDGGRPTTLRLGQKTADGLTLLKASANGAEFQASDGRRRRLDIGGVGRVGGSNTAAAGNSQPRTVLHADARGHFFATMVINGLSLRGMIDTGATGMVMNSREARRLGIDYRKGRRGTASTASGFAVFYRVVLNEIRLGDIVLYQVEAGVLDGDFPTVPLIGNTLLNQLNMERNGDQLIFTKRF